MVLLEIFVSELGISTKEGSLYQMHGALIGDQSLRTSRHYIYLVSAQVADTAGEGGISAVGYCQVTDGSNELGREAGRC